MAKDYTAIRVSTDAKEDAENAKRDGETWDDYIRRCTENPPEIREFVEAGDTTDGSEQLDEIYRKVKQINSAQGDTVNKALEIGEHGFTDIQEQLERIERSAQTVETRTGRIESTLEELGR